MFKGPNHEIDAIFTGPSSAVCGVNLDVNDKKEYLISGTATVPDDDCHILNRLTYWYQCSRAVISLPVSSRSVQVNWSLMA